MIKKLTKAESLDLLKKKARSFSIEQLYYFSINEWRQYSKGIINNIQSIQSSYLIVRSSALNEDSKNCSMAGCYSSKLWVKSKSIAEIKNAVESVIASYEKQSNFNLKNQILVQSQTENVKISGVVLTRDINTGSPYYIINYDDTSGRTDTVTSGLDNKVIIISRFTKHPYKKKWNNLLISLKEIEIIYCDTYLDIEFAINSNDSVIIYQVRPMTSVVSSQDDEITKKIICSIKDKFKRFNKRIPHLSGNTTIFSDMSDWNPSEIIGDNPNTLDYSLYRFLITDNIWHEARNTLGYTDVFPGELMTSFARKPYIDVRLSFNSLIPANLPLSIKDKLINFYICKLYERPELQDKVEFDILWTCYDFSIEKDIKMLLKYGFSENEIQKIIIELKKLTINIIKKANYIFSIDLDAINNLSKRSEYTVNSLEKDNVSVWDLLSGAHYILTSCRKYGTFPFSRLARIAFIASTILLSLKKTKIIDDSCYDNIMLSVETIAKKFSNDFNEAIINEKNKTAFLKKYGHLRSGTYDITSNRYDQQQRLFQFEHSDVIKAKENTTYLHIDEKHKQLIRKALNKAEMNISVESLIQFIIKALEYRELSKFEFTKSLSDSLEILSRFGKIFGIPRNQLCHCDIQTLMKFRNIEIADFDYVKQRIYNSISRHKKEKDWFSNIHLPPVIRSEDDFDYIQFYHSKPNFITNIMVEGELKFVEKYINVESIDIHNKIIMIESADPGFDWIFTKNPLGLITKFGGVASHMAIRCAEFGLPAVIGCGEILFSNLLKEKVIIMDCKNNKLIASKV